MWEEWVPYVTPAFHPPGVCMRLSASPGLLAVLGVQVDAAKWTGMGMGNTAWEASTGMCSPGICAVETVLLWE